MFWGLILEPFKRYSQKVKKAFHITNAALDVTTGDNEICQVMVGSDGKDFLICSLQKGKIIQTPLQLFFKEGSEISITSSGKGTIHLTGFIEPEDFIDSEDESDSEVEDIPQLSQITKKDKKRKAESSPDVVNNKKQKNELSKKVNTKTEKKKVSESSSDDSEEETDIAKLLEVDTDENDESYIPNETSEISMADEEDDDDDEEDDEDDEDEDDDECDDDLDENLESDSENENTAVVTPPKKGKDKQKKDKPQQNGVLEKKNKMNKENEVKNQQEQKTQEDKKEKKVLPGNVAIEDLKVGHGPVAKPGKLVHVYYEGRLKSNNKVFDSCLKGSPFKFKLGKKEVISGWDVGLVGMKVGGKRKIVCPPGMAYGKKGSPPVIPPNSTLVFEVELKNVN